MSVRTTILLLLVLAGTAFVAGLMEVQYVERQKFEVARAALQKEWRKSADDFWIRQSVQLATMVKDLPTDESTLGAILDNKPARLQDRWDTRLLASYGVNALWVFRTDGTLFYARANTQADMLEKSPLPADAIVKIFAREKPPHFFLSVSFPGVSGTRFVEMSGMPIRPAWDREKKEAPQAFLLAGQIWDDERLRESLPPGGDPVQILPAANAGTAPGELGAMQYVLPLRDWQGSDIGQLVFTNENPALAALESRGQRIFGTILFGALVLFVVLYLLLQRAVVSPLRRVIESLHTENVEPLTPLQGHRAEIGELARLIKAFFAQRADLVREMRERSAAEKALHESEEMLRHSQKMEAVGRLAGGVAHDFNNLLTAIIGYADLLRQRFADNPAAQQPAELIHQAGQQAAGLTRQLLAFSRKQLLQPKVVDLNVIITNLHRLLQRIIGEHIQITAVADAVNPRIKADPGQIEQVIVNLGVNARDAMPGGGKLTIRTCNIAVNGAAPVPDLVAGDYVALEVTDTGEGMDEETRARIFEPFFTTKGPGKGTGLGLATVYGIVKQSQGGIAVESARGRGSTFRIYLPQEVGPLETAAVIAGPVKTASREESILVVEDEDIVRELVCEILRGHGYRVLATDRGAEAVRLLREEKREIDLLISDVVMPEMNGACVAQHVLEHCPRARVLFVSGYSESDMADQGLEVLHFQVLQKPFTPDTLISKVRAVLDEAVEAVR